MAGFLDAIFGKKNSLSAEDMMLFKSIGQKIAGEEFAWKGSVLYSKDQTIAIQARGEFEKWHDEPKGFDTFPRTQIAAKFAEEYGEMLPSALVSEGSFLGDGKNWYDGKRLRNILDSLTGQSIKIMLSKKKDRICVIFVGNAEILIAPFLR
jgi:hypothetical protein